jgi:peptide/nickel transport system substrate-binding protein
MKRGNRSWFGNICCAALAFAALGLTSCHKTSSADDSTLRIAFAGDNPSLVSLDPFQVWWIEHRVILRNVAESLTDQSPDTGEIIPWLATSWQINPDGLQYTFTLRNGVTFSDGEPFNAEAVKIAFDSDKAQVEKNPGVFGATYLAGYDHADVIDDRHIRIVLSHPNAAFLQATSTTNLAILAPASYKLTPQQRSLGDIIGTGPFILTSYTPQVGLTLVKRKGYAWPSKAVANPGEAHIDRIVVSYIPEEYVRDGKFVRGDLDIVWPRAPFSETEIGLFKAHSATIYSRSLPGPGYDLFPNASDGRILADRAVRLALQKAIDRPGYAATIYNAQFPVVQSVFDKTTPYYQSEKQRLAYDPQGAEQLLDAAGWKLGQDGYRYKDGRRLTLEELAQGQSPGDELLQDQLRKVGIDLQIDVVVPGSYVTDISAGNYDLVGAYMTRSDPAVLETFLDPRHARASKLALDAYDPADLAQAEQLFDAGLITTDTSKRAAAYGQLQDLLIAEGITFPIYERVWQVAVSKKVHGFTWTDEGFASFNDIEIDR